MLLTSSILLWFRLRKRSPCVGEYIHAVGRSERTVLVSVDFESLVESASNDGLAFRNYHHVPGLGK